MPPVADAGEAARLRALLLGKHREFAAGGAGPGGDGRARLAGEILDATEELLRTETAIAAAAAERARVAVARRIREVSGPAAAALLLFSVGSVAAGLANAWWLLLLLPITACLGVLAVFEPVLPARGQELRVIAAYMLPAAGLLTALAAVHVVPGWVAVIPALIFAGVAFSLLIEAAGPAGEGDSGGKDGPA